MRISLGALSSLLSGLRRRIRKDVNDVDFYADPGRPRVVATPTRTALGDAARSGVAGARASRLSHRAARRHAESSAHVAAGGTGVSGFAADDASGLTTTRLRLVR